MRSCGWCSLQGAALDALPLQDGVTRILLELDTSAASSSALAAVNAPPLDDLHADHLAYMIYTSGSTGKPKGAANTHAGLHNRLAWMQDAYGLTGDDVVLQKTPFSFDVSVWEFFWPLIVGAKLVMAAPGAHRDPARLVETIRHEGVTTLHFVPSMLQAFIEHVAVEGSQAEQAWASLRRVICSGEALPAELRDRVVKISAAGSTGEPVRPDRSLDRRDALGLRRRPIGRGADRPSDLEHAGLCAGRRA